MLQIKPYKGRPARLIMEEETIGIIESILEGQSRTIAGINKEHEKALKEAVTQPFRFALGDMDDEGFLPSLLKQAQEYLKQEIKDMDYRYETRPLHCEEMSDGWYDYYGMLTAALLSLQ